MKKIIVLFILLMMAGCSIINKSNDNENILNEIIKVNDLSNLEKNVDIIDVDINKVNEDHYSIYVDPISSELDKYDDNNKLTSIKVSNKDYVYGYDTNKNYYANINLLDEYERYDDVFLIDWDIYDLNKIENNGNQLMLHFNVKQDHIKDYLKKYEINNEIDNISITMLVDKDNYLILYRSEVANLVNGETISLAEFEYKYNQENPNKEVRVELDNHFNNNDKHRLITIVIDPNTSIEQLITYKIPSGDNHELILPEGYEIDIINSTSTNIDNSNDLTYYLTNPNNASLLIDKEEKVDNIIDTNDSSGFVLLSDVVPDAILEIRYYSTYNFVGSRIDGYEQPLAIISKQAAQALKKVSDELVSKGYRLKIYDAYRPQKAVDHFVRWSKDKDDIKMKEYFYPELDKSVLFEQGYIMEKSGHSRGSTVDLTLFDMKTEKEVDMGGTFDYFGQLSHPDYKDITDEQYANRMLLREVMIKYGFKPLEEEWWHFTLENEPYPDTYFSFPVSKSSLD